MTKPLLEKQTKEDVIAAEENQSDENLDQEELNAAIALSLQTPSAKIEAQDNIASSSSSAAAADASPPRRLIPTGEVEKLKPHLPIIIGQQNNEDAIQEFIRTLEQDPQFAKKVLQTPDGMGRTPILAAAKNNKVSIIEAAESAGIPLETILQMKDRGNKTILSLAINSVDYLKEEMLSKILTMLSKLYEVDPDLAKEILQTPDIKGLTSIHHAAKHNIVSVIEAAERFGITPEEILLTKTQYHETPLHIAIDSLNSPNEEKEKKKDLLYKLLTILVENPTIAFNVLQTKDLKYDYSAQVTPVELMARKLQSCMNEHEKTEIAFPIVTILNSLPLDQAQRLINGLKKEDQSIILEAMDKVNGTMYELNSDFAANALVEKELGEIMARFLGARSSSYFDDRNTVEFLKQSFERAIARMQTSSSSAAASCSTSVSHTPQPTPQHHRAYDEEEKSYYDELPPLPSPPQPEAPLRLQPRPPSQPRPQQPEITITLANDPLEESSAAVATPSLAPSPKADSSGPAKPKPPEKDCCRIS